MLFLTDETDEHKHVGCRYPLRNLLLKTYTPLQGMGAS